ncbi:hypothetical protein ACFSYG_05405 [Leeuwenhoekiella polynyae]|uniref:Lipoprotein n=1 Tax=Leeuwenhoekiella polynyae TaxID=1550906 RepID=A0A4V1KQ86_9FLAO|nr:hypothetical protein [Leeuwenhoekiella polynyae]RXG20542.1 hypothetical protein DSM02_2395 [Leeuwenhoekiella polynyae]|tara:strand:- start:82 stop:729 length:648 start_codon:yes stop_codon:yes gene_type:complete
MRVLLLFCSVLLISSCKENPKNQKTPIPQSQDAGSETPEPISSPQTLTNIEDIKKEYSRLTQLLKTKDLDSTSFTYNCNGEKSGTVVFFSDTTGLKVIRHAHNEYSHFEAADLYYLRDEVPFFVFSTNTTWSFSGGTADAPQTTDNVVENRFYLLNGEPVDCLRKQYSIKSDEANPVNPNTITNQKTDCKAIEDYLETYKLLLKHRETTSEITCL